jgi:alpha-tubulin suppressor-like RCC1 family protein
VTFRVRILRPVTVVGAATLALTAAVAPVAAASSPPTVSSLSSCSGPVGGHAKVTVHGSGFSAVSAVLFGGAKGGSVHVISSRLLTVVVPAHKPARVEVRVVTGHGESARSKHDVYAYVAAPVVSVVSVTTGPVAGGVKVTVKGSGFTHVKKVLFGRAVGTQLHVLSAKTLTVTAPAHAAGRVDVRVVSAYGTSKVKGVDRFTFVPPVVEVPTPVITTSLLPAAEQGQPYSTSVSVSSGQPPYTVSATGLPLGLTMSGAGVLSGRSFVPPKQYPVMVSVVDALGHSATAALTLSVTQHAGQVFAWGDNLYGEVGTGATGPTVTVPVSLPALTGVVQTVAGGESGYALRSDGTVYAWGQNPAGQLGIGSTSAMLSPTQIPGLTGVASLAAGGTTAYAVKTDGTVLAWGGDAVGQLGDGATTNATRPQPVPGLSHIVQVTSGYYTAYALDADGHVWSWGNNDVGELGSGTPAPFITSPTQIPGVSGVREVVSEGDTAHVLLADGTALGWGNNDDGEVGDTTTNRRTTPVAVFGLTGATQLAQSNYATFALLADGTVRGWGRGGQVGDGTVTDRLSPQVLPGLTGVASIGSNANGGVVTEADGTVKVWGYGGQFDCNADGTTADVAGPEVNLALSGMTSLGGHGAAYGIR